MSKENNQEDADVRLLREKLAQVERERDYYRSISQQSGQKALVDTAEFQKTIKNLRETEKSLRTAQEDLDRKVAERTAELARLNAELLTKVRERTEAERALRESEERYRLLTETSRDSITVADSSGIIKMLNKRALEIYNHKDASEALGRSIFEWVPQESREKASAAYAQVLSGESLTDFEIRLMKRGGELFWASINATPVFALEGIPQLVMLITTDITGRRQAEETRREMLMRLQSLVDNVQQGILFDNGTRRIESANRAFCDLFGISSPESVVGEDCSVFARQAKVYFTDPEGFVGNIEKRLTEKRIVLSEEITLKDGRTLERDYIPVATDDVHHGSYWIYRDITDRKRREERLNRINEGLIKLGHDHDKNLNILTALCGELLEADCALYNRLDGDLLCVKGQWNAPADLKTEDSPQGHLCFDVIQGNGDRPLVVRHLQDTAYAETDPNVSAYRLLTYIGYPVTYDGVTRGSLCVVYTRDRKPSGDDLHIIGILAAAVAQVEERTKAAEALREREQFIRNILDSVDEGFLVVDLDYRIMTANRAFCSSIRSRHEEIVGRRCHRVVHGYSGPCHENGEDCAVKNALETGRPHATIYKHEDASGNMVFVEKKGFPLKDASGKVVSAIETITNVTERHLLDAERLKTQKLEAIGRLAGGIAHDFNNLLQGVFGYISMAKTGLTREQKAFAMLEQAEKALQMSVNLTGQLLTFSKGGKPVKQVITLLPVMENAARFALSGSSSDFQMSIEEHLWRVEADEGQIWQVLQNIVLNASEAMPNGGTVGITAGNLDVPEGSNPLLPKGGRFVRITVQDSGMGIPEQYLSRIFDPYFTTKQKGSGLGLATAYSIITNHGGVIEVSSEKDRGTEFMICLPASLSEELKTGIPDVSAGRRGNILVMDDEEIVRTVLTEMISVLGHEVETAEDGEEAISRFLRARESGSHFDVLILDLTIKGGMGGEQVVKQLLAIEPNVKAVVSSGYSDNPILSDYRSHGFAGFLNKPYRFDELRDCLNSLLK